jgi:hypothetical protein
MVEGSNRFGHGWLVLSKLAAFSKAESTFLGL